MRRREFNILLGACAVAWPFAARAQQGAVPIIGFLNPGSPIATPHLVAAFKDGLAEAGYVEGRNVAIEYRWGGGSYDRMPDMAADLVRRQVAVIVTGGGPAPASAAKAATSSIPIVFTSGTDPVDSGLVKSLSRPDANVTGVHVLTVLLSTKRQELLHEVVPSAATVAGRLIATPPSAGPNARTVGKGTVAAAAPGSSAAVTAAAAPSAEPAPTAQAEAGAASGGAGS